MSDEEKSDSQLLDTQAIEKPIIVCGNPNVNKNTANRVGFVIGFLSVIVMLGAVLYFIVYIHKDQQTAHARVDITIEQINNTLLPILEEHIAELSSRIDNLGKDVEALKDNCTDIRYIISPKFGKKVLIPIQRLRPAGSPDPAEEHVSLPKIKSPRVK